MKHCIPHLFHDFFLKRKALRPGPVLTIVLKTFLGFRRDGGRPQDVQVVKNWPAFVARDVDEFDYNVVTKYLGLRARSEPSCTLVKVCAVFCHYIRV